MQGAILVFLLALSLAVPAGAGTDVEHAAGATAHAPEHAHGHDLPGSCGTLTTQAHCTVPPGLVPADTIVQPSSTAFTYRIPIRFQRPPPGAMDTPWRPPAVRAT